MNYATNFIKKNKLSKKVNFCGWIPNKKIKYYYEKSDVFVLPSWHEGMPNSLIEALSCGLSSIVTNVGTIPNFLRDNKNTLFVQPKNPKSIFNAMEKLMLDEKLKISISKNGFKVANKYFSTDKGLNLLVNHIKLLF